MSAKGRRKACPLSPGRKEHIMKALIGLAFGTALVLPSAASEHAAIPVSELSHIHGVVLSTKSDLVLLATHYGLFAVDSAGSARMVSEAADDFMGFTAAIDGTLYASGHPATGGNIGIIGAESADAPWSKLSDGAQGPVDFHALTVSPADPLVLYGTYGGIQISRDGGRTWSMAGTGPEEVIDVAAGADDPGQLFAGTMTGLMESKDYGATWTIAAAEGLPVTAVETAPDGTLRLFIAGTGFARLDAGQIEVISNRDEVFLHMAFDREDPNDVMAVTAESDILASNDGGKTWSAFAP
tara:strand:- start:6218 stop:7108 length:891 start_codon:yes stop_codon:yes gene_type:complete